MHTATLRPYRSIQIQGSAATIEAALWTSLSANKKNPELIVFLHGGYFAADDSAALNGLFVRLRVLRPHTVILAPRYTLATQQPFPAALEDVYSALQWTSRHKAALGWGGQTLIVAGIEAGGSLAAAVALVSRDRSGRRIDAQILLLPMLDPTLTTRSMREADADPRQSVAAHRCASGYRGYLPHVQDRVHPYAAPLYASRLQGLPPALLFSAEYDPLRDEAQAYVEKLAAHGVPASLVHVPAISLHTADAYRSCAADDRVAYEISNFLSALFP